MPYKHKFSNPYTARKLDSQDFFLISAVEYYYRYFLSDGESRTVSLPGKDLVTDVIRYIYLFL